MSIANDKIVNLQDVKVLYDDLRGRIKEQHTYEKSITESSAIQSFEGGAWPMGMQIAVDPVQDLHGYDHPWPGGGGKNLLPTPYYSSSSTYDGITSVVHDDGSVTFNGTATTTYWFNFASHLQPIQFNAGSYILSCNGGGSNPCTNNVFVVANVRVVDTNKYGVNCKSAESVAFNPQEDGYLRCYLQIDTGIAVSNLTIKPMIRLSTETDASYAPYSNVCPITGWTGAKVSVAGKNLLKNTSPSVSGNGNVFTRNADGTVTASGTPTGFTPYPFSAFKCYGIRDKTIVISGLEDTTNVVWNSCFISYSSDYVLYDITGIANKTGPITIDLSNYNIRENHNLYVTVKRLTNNTPISGTIKPMIRLATETDSSFEPYSGSVYSITFPTSAGTVYGGNLTVNKDGTGTLVVDRAMDELSSLTWNTRFTGTTNQTLSALLQFSYPKATDNVLISEQYVNNGFVMGANDLKRPDEIEKGIFYYCLDTATLEQLKTVYAVIPINDTPSGKIVYPLGSPITYTLTPGQVLSLIGKNHVWADTGDILSLTYNSKQGIEFIREDTAGQIAPVKEELNDAEAAMAIVVDGDTAPKNISSGQYVFVKNHSTLATGMYHATAAIASGASVTGSNVEADADGGINALNGKIETVETATIERVNCDSAGINQIRKNGKIVSLNYEPKRSTKYERESGLFVIGQIPEGFRPAQNVNVVGVALDSANSYPSGFFSVAIRSNGNITVLNHIEGNINYTLCISASYVC